MRSFQRRQCTEYGQSVLTLFVGRQEEHLACKKLGVGLFVGLTCLIAPVVTTTFIILICNKIQNGDILLPGYLNCPGKWPLTECQIVKCLRLQHDPSHTLDSGSR